MTDLEWAWAAGFFDGEGTTSLHPKGVLWVSLHQVDIERTQRFARIISGNIWEEPRNGRLPIQRATATGRAAKRALDGMWPHLSTDKKRQALTAIGRLCSQEFLVSKPAACWDDEPAARRMCARGHSMVGAYIDTDGQRECVKCRRLRRAAYKAGIKLPAIRWYRNPEWWIPGKECAADVPYWLTEYPVEKEVAA